MIATIVLAAGRSARMGAHKLLLPLGDRPIVAHVVGAALASALRPVVVVLGHEAARVRAALPPGEFRIVENPLYADGLSTSLRAGLDALPQDVTGAVVALADQPLVTAAHLRRIAEAALTTGATIVVATYDGQRGTPTYFARSHFAELRAVSGDAGGRIVIARHPAAVLPLELGDRSVALDVDVPADYEQILALWRERAP
jgi:molybdenum cofactor cytidylyltransferase